MHQSLIQDTGLNNSNSEDISIDRSNTSINNDPDNILEQSITKTTRVDEKVAKKEKKEEVKEAKNNSYQQMSSAA